LALLDVHEFLQPYVSGLEHRDVDFEVARYLLNDPASNQFERGAIGGIAGGADRRRGKMIEQAPRRVLFIGEKTAIDQRGLENRHLQAAEQSAQRFGNRRVAKDVVE